MNIKHLNLGKVLCVILVSVLFSSLSTSAQQRALENIPYREGSSDIYIKEQCLLDIYVPEGVEGFPTVVWFHGGGLTSGHREIPERLKNNGFAVVGVGYRFSPKVETVQCIDDAAAAVSWVFDNIEKFGGDSSKIYLSGHSAGGYLSTIITMDRDWLSKYGIEANDIAALISYSGHSITHFETRRERGIKPTAVVVDSLAPLSHVRSDAPPIVLISGDRELELYGRYEESAYFWRMMRLSGHKDCVLYELEGFNHGTMATPAHEILINFINEREKSQKNKD
ncbi:MAG: alpha/beta hydrolase [Rikenellaceae bacterium]